MQFKSILLTSTVSISIQVMATSDVREAIFDKSDSGEVRFNVVASNDKFDRRSSTFKFDKQEFFATYWVPAEVSNIKAAVFFSHGYGEYLGAGYDEIGQYLAENGIMAFGHDHQGHGRSTGQKVQVDSMDEYADPILAHVKAVKSWQWMDSKPVFLLGHSMGGLISLFTLFKDQSLFKGVLFNGPLLIIDPDLATPFKKFVAKVLRDIVPSFALGEISAKDITRNETFVEQYKNDPLVWHGGFKSKHSFVLLESCDYAQNNLPNITIPVLALQGGKDKLVVPRGTQMIFDTVSSADKEVKFYDDAFHNLFVELEDVKQDSFQRVKEFILKRA